MITRASRIINNCYGLGKKKVLDIGCGSGEFLRGFGQGSIGITTDMKEVEFGKVNSIPIYFGNAEDIKQEHGAFEALWANNLFEHLLSPHRFLMRLAKAAKPGAILILGVPVVPKIVSLMNISKFRGALASNHVNFFTSKTLSLTVERAGWKVTEVRPFIFKNAFLDRLIRPFAPHIYVVATFDPNFKYPNKKYNEWKADPAFADLLEITRQR